MQQGSEGEIYTALMRSPFRLKRAWNAKMKDLLMKQINAIETLEKILIEVMMPKL
jgi:hypothetical protein